MTTMMAVAAAVATKTPVETVVVWVVAHPYFLLGSHAGVLQKLANNIKVGIAGKIFSRQTNLSHLIKANL